MEIHGRSAANLGGSSRGVKKLKMATRVYRLENVDDGFLKNGAGNVFQQQSPTFSNRYTLVAIFNFLTPLELPPRFAALLP
jgi:hypothetical protein